MNTETDAIRSTLAHRVAELTEQNKVIVAALESCVTALGLSAGHISQKLEAVKQARAALKK